MQTCLHVVPLSKNCISPCVSRVDNGPAVRSATVRPPLPTPPVQVPGFALAKAPGWKCLSLSTLTHHLKQVVWAFWEILGSKNDWLNWCKLTGTATSFMKYCSLAKNLLPPGLPDAESRPLAPWRFTVCCRQLLYMHSGSSYLHIQALQEEFSLSHWGDNGLLPAVVVRENLCEYRTGGTCRQCCNTCCCHLPQRPRVPGGEGSPSSPPNCPLPPGGSGSLFCDWRRSPPAHCMVWRQWVPHLKQRVVLDFP